MNQEPRFISHEPLRFEEKEIISRSEELHHFAEKRRSIRQFSDRDIPFEVIRNIIMTANTAPSGAHKQPWTFCVIRSQELKQKIRIAAEKEEKESYEHRMSDRWLKDLEPFGTDWRKPFIETVPWIIVVFKRAFEFENGEKHQNYYVNESVGIACGMLINAIHNAGLATLTHTPSPMNFLTKILDRPDNERPYLLLPVGYPANEIKVPNLTRKSFDQVAKIFD
mgnify:CR=1 FL=1